MWAFIQLTLLVIYNDGLCSLCYTTNFLKDGCLASIGPSYDKNAKMRTFVLLPESCHIPMSSCKEPVKFQYRCGNTFNDSPDVGAPATSTILAGEIVGLYMWNLSNKLLVK